MSNYVKKLTRRQQISSNGNLNVNDYDSDIDSNNSNRQAHLVRSFGLISLTLLNISNSIGSGIYVLTGLASNSYAGQFVVVSYMISALPCLLSAFCFAEFSARIKSSSGSSYSFVYCSLGELCAFLLGWINFLGSLGGVSATSITWSSYFDSMTNGSIKYFIVNNLHASWDFGDIFSTFLNLPALFILTFFFIISLLGMEVTSFFNNILAILNIFLLVIISIAGLIYGKFENLKTTYTNGLDGIIRGSSIVMYAYFGFETSTFAIDETINPSRNVPLSLLISLSIITLVYSGASFSLNLMQPYDQIDPKASYPTAFKSVGWMYWIVSIGPVVSLAGSVFISVYSISRIAYAMSKDGLLFKFLSKINKETKVPHLSIITSLIICLILTLSFNVKDLIGFSDITGFLSYSLTATGLLVIRYFNIENESHQKEIDVPENERVNLNTNANELHEIQNDETDLLIVNETRSNINLLDSNSNLVQVMPKNLNRTKISLIREKMQNRFQFFKNRTNAIFLIIYVFISNVVLFGILHKFNYFKILLFVIAFLSNLICSIMLYFFDQPGKVENISFKVPLVPFIPVLVIMFNVYLMMACETMDWIILILILLLGNHM